MMHYYPMAPGNKWEYKLKDGTTYSNTVTNIDGKIVTLRNSTAADPTRVKVEDGVMFNELMTPENYQVWLKDDLKAGDTWEATFTANGLKSIMEFTVLEVGASKEVNGQIFTDVIGLEAESNIEMNGSRIATNFRTQYYYAKGIGLIMTTSSMGDEHALQSYVLN